MYTYTHAPGDGADKCLLFHSINKLLSCEHSWHPSCFCPSVSPTICHQTWTQETILEIMVIFGVLQVVPISVYRTLSHCPKSISSPKSLSQNFFFSDAVALWILAAHWGKRGHAQGLMPTKDCQGPSFCLEGEPLKWTKRKPNTRSFLTIHLFNGPLMFHKEFEFSYLQCKSGNKAFIIQQLTQQHVAKVRCCDKKFSHKPVQKQVTLCLPGVGTVSGSALLFNQVIKCLNLRINCKESGPET